MSEVSRREFLQLIGAGSAILLLPPGCGSSGFLSDAERRTLGALANAVLPPDDVAGGAALGAVEYIEALLTAFDHDPPTVFLGGPYSGRAPFADDHGAPSANLPANDFLKPIALDRVAERAWRLRLYGSAGVDGGGPNDAVLGPIVGLRDLIKQAIAQARGAAGKTPVESLDPDALAALFAGLDADYRDALIALVPEGAFGAPEYGGNPGGAGWRIVHFEGDQMPLGYSVFDVTAGVYRERADAPVTTADVEPDPEPLDDLTRTFLQQLVQALGGKEFPWSVADLPTLAPVGNRALTQYDVLIIGSGAGGGAVANILCANGMKVLVLEAGPNYFVGLDDGSKQPSTLFANDEVKLAARNFITPDANVEPRTWRTDDSQVRTFVGDVQALPKTVGGGAAHADLKMPRFLPADFHLGTMMTPVPGASFADWPVDYAALELFYAYAEKVVGVQGKSGAFPQEGARSGEFPMPPGLAAYFSQRVATGLQSLGYTPFPYPSAINSRPYDGRPACADCGFCSGFPCPSNAKGSPPVTTLRRALLSGNCLLLPGTRAVKLVMNGASVAGVEAILPSGERRTFTADRYVLAASPIEDARLLLLSDPGGAGVGNSSGMVGRNLTFHLQTQAIGIFEERLHGHRSRAVDTGFGDFRGVPNDPMRPLGGIVEISAGEGPVVEAAFYKRVFDIFGFDGPRFKRLMRQSPGRDRAIALVLQAEDAPQPTNRVDLDPDVRDLDGLPVARVTYKSHAWELAARDFYAPKLLQILGASGARWAALAPSDDIPGSAHIMGTLRFGSDPATSVCDADGRFHDVGNLYAADGALFPTSSGFNPTMTIMALATRVGAAIVSPGSPERALG